MDGLPLLPGFVFIDPSENNFHVPHTLNYKNGHILPRPPKLGTGQRPLDADSVAHLDLDQWSWDPSLTYGEPRPEIHTKVNPKYAEFANQTLAFRAFCVEPRVMEDDPRVRQVWVYFHLEDDSMSIMEPPIPNSGFVQGKVLRRHRVHKTTDEDEDETYWHWKDLNVGADVWMYGRNYHLASCDAFTREFLTSQGIEVGADEDVPQDPYTTMQRAGAERRARAEREIESQREAEAGAVLDKLGRFLVYDRQVLRFYAVQRDPPCISDAAGEEAPRRFHVLFYLSDGSLEVRHEYEHNDGHYHFPKLVARRPLPRHGAPVDFPSLCATEGEFYGPEHLRVGETITVLGRTLLLYDCDVFTREYYRRSLRNPQPERMDLETASARPQPVVEVPPHSGLGSPEDSLQSCLRLVPRPPRAVPCVPTPAEEREQSERNLRYALRMDTERPADQTRQFVLIFEPRRGLATINELPKRNSGVLSGRFLGPLRLVKPRRPGQPPPTQPEFYGPQDFGIGAVLVASGQRFVVTNADLYVLRWLEKRRGHFPPQLEHQLRDHLTQQGVLKDN